MLILLVLLPMVFAGSCLALPGSLTRRLALVAGAAAHLALVLRSWQEPFAPMYRVLLLDPVGHLFVTLISVLFLAVSVFFVGYHRKALLSQRIFLACLLALESALTLACMSQHLGLLWVALETSSLACTPLIYFRIGPRALEATWKFLLMNSVGIALALLGTFCIALSTTPVQHGLSVTLSALIQHARELDSVWMRAGFLLALVGYGTKMGLAPMHSWKPDAYGEAPPPVAALLAGGMTLAAFLGLLRVFQVCAAAGQAQFAAMWMNIFGLLSIATAAVFVIGNRDYRRLLAYTSIEHMGVLVLGIGLGAASSYGSYATMLHAMHNTLNKGILFFAAGMLWRLYNTNRIDDVRGTLHRNRGAGILLLLGLCATSGLPPFGMFFSELGILIAAVQSSQWVTAGLFVLTLAVVFVGVWTAMLPMAFGEPSQAHVAPGPPERAWRQWVMLTPAVALLLLAAGLGAYQPRAVRDALDDAARSVYAGPTAMADQSSNRPLSDPLPGYRARGSRERSSEQGRGAGSAMAANTEVGHD
jgi:hydrogenase-4 component F